MLDQWGQVCCTVQESCSRQLEVNNQLNPSTWSVRYLALESLLLLGTLALTTLCVGFSFVLLYVGKLYTLSFVLKILTVPLILVTLQPVEYGTTDSDSV